MLKIYKPWNPDLFCLTRYTSSRAVETVTSPPTPSASVASATAAKKAPGSSVSVASEVVGIYIFVGLIVTLLLLGVHYAFQQECGHWLSLVSRQNIWIELLHKKKCVIYNRLLIHAHRQNWLHSQPPCLVPFPWWNPCIVALLCQNGFKNEN